MTNKNNFVFDSLLHKQGIIGGCDVSCVHGWVEDYLKNCSWQARESKPDVNEVKAWIFGECSQKNPELLTDYLRVALGHILLSSFSAGFSFGNEYELMKQAFQTYLDRGYQCCTVEAGEDLLVGGF